MLTAFLVAHRGDPRDRVMNAVHCFLRQTVERKQLIVVNASGERFDFDSSSVKVIDAKDTFSGVLKNQALSASSGLCFNWSTSCWYSNTYLERFAREIPTYPGFFRKGGFTFVGFSIQDFPRARYDLHGSDEALLAELSGTCELDLLDSVEVLDAVRYTVRPAQAKQLEEPVTVPRFDYPVLPKAAATSSRATVWKSAEPCLVCLGRYGDVLSALPLAKHIFDSKGTRPAFVVSSQFADILDGVSYVKGYVYNGDYSELELAVRDAEQCFSRVIPVQVFGAAGVDTCGGIAHNRLAWKRVGYDQAWAACRQLVLDRRDPARERKLVKLTIQPSTKPVLLLMLTGGHSSPLKEGPELTARLTEELSARFNIVDLAKVKAGRIYDLLALYEVAAALVTIDSATLHLASAVPSLPVLALTPDNSFMAAEPRCSCELSVRYSEVEQKYAAISSWILSKASQPKVVLVHEDHGKISERERRAQSTWNALFEGHGWSQLKFSEPYPRSSKDIGDPRGVPYVNDMLEAALRECADSDVVVIVNSDIILCPGIHSDLLKALSHYPATCSSRRDVDSFSDVSTQPEVETHVHWGRDVFAFRAWWLRELLRELPPLLLGTREWDNVILNALRRKSGTLISGDWSAESARTITDVELASPNVFHEKHNSYGDDPEFTYSNANQWNNVQLIQWSRSHCSQVRFCYAEQSYADWQSGKLTFKATT